jgi:hypothetical protein
MSNVEWARNCKIILRGGSEYGGSEILPHRVHKRESQSSEVKD